jgi:enoyl-[acyl-carrier-protein] reductase (NADH)
MPFFCRSADLYEGIADTFVQLFASGSAGLIAAYPARIEKGDMAKNRAAIVTGPMGSGAEVSDVVDADLYLANARQVSGEVLHVDGGAHIGRW